MAHPARGHDIYFTTRVAGVAYPGTLQAMKYSDFGKRLSRHTGARELMDDLGVGMASETPVMMLGGGNPAHIPEMLDRFRSEMYGILDDDREFRRMVADYSEPAGDAGFRTALAELLNREFGWPLGPENIALTGGSQHGFFLLFNLLAGKFSDGSFRRILLPLAPEYIGYKDLGISGDLFVSGKPTIEHLEDRQFKYHVDFSDLRVDDSIAAICASRPTNPTGNVLTDEEVSKLSDIAKQNNVPLILDNAYGVPFPNIIFTDITPIWDEHIILCMSLSKIGLPALRSGIIIAGEEIVDALAGMNAVTSLSVGSVGPVLLKNMVQTGEIIKLSEDVIRPYYQRRVSQALEYVHASLDGCNYHIHKPEGALFLWLWFPDLSISCAELYRRLKKRGVYVVSGDHFFPGLTDDWVHRDQCIRVTYARDSESVRKGIEIIGEEVRQVSAGGRQSR